MEHSNIVRMRHPYGCHRLSRVSWCSEWGVTWSVTSKGNQTDRWISCQQGCNSLMFHIWLFFHGLLQMSRAPLGLFSAHYHTLKRHTPRLTIVHDIGCRYVFIIIYSFAWLRIWHTLLVAQLHFLERLLFSMWEYKDL